MISTEKNKMLNGELYNAADPVLFAERRNTRLLLKRFNDSRDDQTELRQELLRKLFPFHGIGLAIEPPFYCDYGTNIVVGDNVFFNFNCIVLDVMRVTIGRNVLIGPAVQIYTALHPFSWEDRAAGLEFAKPVTIGSDVWIGGGAIICPGITIGNRSIVGAGSVVTKDVPTDVFAAGNPCKTIRSLQ